MACLPSEYLHFSAWQRLLWSTGYCPKRKRLPFQPEQETLDAVLITSLGDLEDWSGNNPGRGVWIINQNCMVEIYALIAKFKQEP
ncbi:hypothetical protein H8S90_09880 [Olivibacter sp. SDN3]|uniref:hypothetical protein n=1 Tax=Olivibacter sp. SDN3 TaxID=2764720 RepID=UPI0016512F2A|nr:hypothetical protein [Olivibacter sp. SDN3]QNL51850.1 hypothetical protein H8S90_09880 [Olivibacter sp. SDN3]